MSDRRLIEVRALASQEKAPTEPVVAPARKASIVPALVVAVLSFVVVLGIVAAVWVLTARGSAAPADEKAIAGNTPSSGSFDIVTLLENYHFVTPLPPTGDRSITYQYSITLKVVKSRRPILDELVAVDRKNMLPVVKENIRKIIAAEDYLKLRAEHLDDVKAQIRHYLNTLMGSEVVDEVIFDKWNVIS